MKRLLIALVVLVLVVVVGAGVALSLVDANRFRPEIQSSLSQAMGRPVTLGKLHVSLWSGALEADNINIADDPAFGQAPFIRARQLAVGVHLWPLLLHRELRVTSLTLDQPQVRLVRNRAGAWNFSSLGGGSGTGKTSGSSAGAPAFSVDALRIKDGTIVLQHATGGSHRYTHVNLSADHVGTRAAFPFSMRADIAGGGTLAMDGTIGPWNAGNAVLTPFDAHLVMHGLDLVGAGLMEKGQGVGGVIDLDTHLHAEHGEVQSKGTIRARTLQLVASGSPAPQPVQLDYQARYRLVQGTGSMDHTTLGTGRARLGVSGHFDNRGTTLRLDLRLQGKQLPVDDLQPLLPAFGVVLPKHSRLTGGTLGADLHVHGPLDALQIDGPVALDNTTLAGYSLGSKMGAALALAGIHAPDDTVIKHARAMLAIRPTGIRVDPASADVTGVGSITGKGRMAADGSLDFNMRVNLASGITGSQGVGGMLGRSRAGRLLGGVLGGRSGQGIGVHVTGTASDPVFRLDPSAVAGLLESGLDGKPAPSTPAPTHSKPASTRDVLGNLLRGALQKKSTSGGH